nr:hypothetical protein [Asaia platycodi]
MHIYTTTDQAWGDKALYDIDQAVLVMTGKALKLTTPQDVMTARDVMEYHANTRMSVGRGDATVTTNDGKRIKADVLVAFSKPDSAAPAPARDAASPNGVPARRNVRPSSTAPMPGGMSCCAHPTRPRLATVVSMCSTRRWRA